MSMVTSLFKKNNAGALAAAQAAAAQRSSLAQMARDGAAADAASGKSGMKKGRSLLSFLGAEGAGGLVAA